jgi:3-oxoacyl-[acyl-carrier-protein] synthase-3
MPNFMKTNIGIFEANYYLPSTKKTLAQVFADEEKPTESFAANVDFEKDIGIDALHVAKEETAADLCINAARLTMSKSGIDPQEIDLIIDFTSIPEDYVAPTWSAAGQVQQAIGATRAFTTAINTGGCASYQTTLKVACSLMSANDRYNTALLVAGDKTPEFNHNYFPITVVSDGGSAVILKKNMTTRRILGVEVATVGRLHDMWVIPGIHNRKAEDIGGKYPRWLHVCGDIQRFNKELIPINLFMFRKVMLAVLKQVGKKMQDVDYFVYPTFSAWDQDAFLKAFNLPREKVSTENMHHGHLQETDMVVGYVDALEAGKIKDGDLVMLATNGAGFSWGASLVQH